MRRIGSILRIAPRYVHGRAGRRSRHRPKFAATHRIPDAAVRHHDRNPPPPFRYSPIVRPRPRPTCSEAGPIRKRAIWPTPFPTTTRPGRTLGQLVGATMAGRGQSGLEPGRRGGADYQHLVQLQPNETRWRIALDKLGVSEPPPSQSVARAQPRAAQPQPPKPPAQAVATLAGRRPRLGCRRSRSPCASSVTRSATPTALSGCRRGKRSICCRPITASRQGVLPTRNCWRRSRRKFAEQTELNRRAQVALHTLGLYHGTSDGDFGPRSSEALSAVVERKRPTTFGPRRSAALGSAGKRRDGSNSRLWHNSRCWRSSRLRRSSKRWRNSRRWRNNRRWHRQQAQKPQAPTEQNFAQLPSTDQPAPAPDRTGRPERAPDVARTLAPQSGHEAPGKVQRPEPIRTAATLTPQDTAPAKQVTLFETKERRVALVIGNSKYQKVPTLSNLKTMLTILRGLTSSSISTSSNATMCPGSDMPDLVHDFGIRLPMRILPSPTTRVTACRSRRQLSRPCRCTGSRSGGISSCCFNLTI